MAKGLEGNSYEFEGNKYLVLKEINYKNLLFVYTMKVIDNDEEGEKKYFQVEKIGGEYNLIDVISNKLIKTLSEKIEQDVNIPRKINEDESIEDYMAFLDDFYRSKIISSI